MNSQPMSEVSESTTGCSR